MSTTVVDFDPALLDAASCYTQRQARTAHPKGSTDKAGRWFPSSSERQVCCESIRSPSRAHPWSYMLHCRTASHCAALYGVDERALRRAVRTSTPRRAVEKHLRYKVVSVQEVPENTTEDTTTVRYHGLYDGRRYVVGQTYRQAAKPHHGGGFYVRQLVAEHGDLSLTLEEAFCQGLVWKRPAPGCYAILACEVWGKCVSYDNGKEAWTTLRPCSVYSTFTVD